jgi:hypothetical protein
MQVGEKIYLTGRVQSREYQKRLETGEVETRTAYELSINRLSKEPIESAFIDGDTAFVLSDSELMEEIGTLS